MTAAAVAFGQVADGSGASARASVTRGSIEDVFGDLHAVAVAGGGLRKLTPPERLDSVPAISPTGRQIAFATSPAQGAFAGPRHSVVVARLDRSRPRTLMQKLYAPREFAWSADGRRLVFSAERWLNPPGSVQPRWLYLVDLASGQVRRIAGADASEAEWSREGRLAYWRGATRSVVVADRDGKPLWSTRGAPGGWSPDGTKLAVTRGETLLILSRDGRRLASFGGVGLRTFAGFVRVSWAPDSQKFAFPRLPAALWVASLRDRRAHRIATLHPESDGWSSWSPDGRRLAYVGRVEHGSYPRTGTFVVRPAAGQPRLVKTDSRPITWASDRSLLVWRSVDAVPSERELAVVPVAGGAATALARFDVGDAELHAELSPDRRTVIIARLYV